MKLFLANNEKKLKEDVGYTNSMFSFYKIKSDKAPIPGYFVVSTAPINLEDRNEDISKCLDPEILKHIEKDGLEEIADDIRVKNKEAGASEEVELVIAIHGYNNTVSDVKNWYKKILDFANNDETLRKNFVFLGYRWPSESFTHNLKGNLWNAFNAAFSAMPFVLQVVFIFGLLGIFSGIFLSFLVSPIPVFVILLVFTILFSIPLTLILIRLLVYFRDSYRATNFAIPDLVELIRQIDDRLLTKAVEQFKIDNRPTFEALRDTLEKLEKLFGSVIDKKNNHNNLITELLKDYLKSENYWTGGELCIPKVLRSLGISHKENAKKEPDEIEINQKLKKISEGIRESFENVARKEEFGWIKSDDKRIRLTFLCHSMGAFVTTGAVRILADVFDQSSVNTLDQSRLGKLPTSNIGHVFRLGRLILVSPDIPQIAITSTRSNFLRASLRRFEEAYLFSNEGDMALLVASTSANYFSLPTRTGERSFRLGNLTVNRKKDDYGIVNFKNLQELDSKPDSDPENLLHYLEIGEKPLSPKLGKTICNETHDNPEPEELIANLFTYFDCTDYTDWKHITNGDGKEKLTKKSIRVLSYPLKDKSALYKFFTQVRLVIDGFISKSIDVHGGYFDGKLSRELIYRLAFGGFNNLRNCPEVEKQSETKTDLSPLSKISYISEILKSKKIRVALSPERYLVDMKGWDRNRAREKVMYKRNRPKLNGSKNT